jgi:hypothetical protein
VALAIASGIDAMTFPVQVECEQLVVVEISANCPQLSLLWAKGSGGDRMRSTRRLRP